MTNMDLFNSISYLEPRCKNCGSKIDYGVTTYFDEKIENHRCCKCDCKLD